MESVRSTCLELTHRLPQPVMFKGPFLLSIDLLNICEIYLLSNCEMLSLLSPGTGQAPQSPGR
eukprot:1161508-Pelagomonas_calceolata.AAC.20